MIKKFKFNHEAGNMLKAVNSMDGWIFYFFSYLKVLGLEFTFGHISKSVKFWTYFLCQDLASIKHNQN